VQREQQVLQLLVSEAAVRQERDPNLWVQPSVQLLNQVLFVPFLVTFERRLLVRPPGQWGGATMTGDQVGGQSGVPVVVEVCPIQRDHELPADPHHEGHPRLESRVQCKIPIGQQPVDLPDPALGADSCHLRVGLSDRVDGEHSHVADANYRVGKRFYALGVLGWPEDDPDVFAHTPG
jgi:hypothetical protein